ncbi:DNA-3-methyladenine glycosylase [Mucisphaera calidilacus]|uniref:Putative 3-methyladenine DNA glycosylase n=1 Tax=Mucisphaera calidilacus TaxID=2527982 RepID=A0A518BYP3_9BACT|nr:DNA-3-methyladenine glycosylase [Mucisphaera calidilacus]QDU72093.1 3-methyladenine DNA glycosylase [Mucisphaera calidilacus]
MPDRLRRSFFRKPADRLAADLLGQRLVRAHRGHRRAGIIVETEAYLGTIDAAAHTYQGRRTPRNEAMYADAGHAYVYFTYGMHHCMNVVAHSADTPEAVLIRALEPAEGLEAIRRRRPKARRDTDLTSGPAKLCAALDIDRKLNAADLTSSTRLWIEPGHTITPDRIVRTPRIGIDYAAEWTEKPLRFCLRNHPHLSRPAP